MSVRGAAGGLCVGPDACPADAACIARVWAWRFCITWFRCPSWTDKSLERLSSAATIAGWVAWVACGACGGG